MILAHKIKLDPTEEQKTFLLLGQLARKVSINTPHNNEAREQSHFPQDRLGISGNEVLGTLVGLGYDLERESPLNDTIKSINGKNPRNDHSYNKFKLP